MSEAYEARPIRPRVRRAGWYMLLLFWCIQFAELIGMSWMSNGRLTIYYVLPRLALVIFGIALTAGLLEVLIAVIDRAFRTRIAVAILSALVVCGLQATANYLLFYVILPRSHDQYDTIATFFWLSMSWSWFFVSIAGAILALSYSLDAAGRDAQLADLKMVAQTAQLRALRYQLNPHFLFNTLNSIAALIGQRNNATAEAMVENLSDFLRTTLEFNAADDVTLDRELQLQQLYLDIEMLRFPDRLRLVIEVPRALRKALVPSLILQPLVENAIKYAVARSPNPVTLRIAAEQRGIVLAIEVSDSGGGTGGTVAGTGVGLANVSARLRARFGPGFDVQTSGNADGGFTACLSLPFRES